MSTSVLSSADKPPDLGSLLSGEIDAAHIDSWPTQLTTGQQLPANEEAKCTSPTQRRDREVRAGRAVFTRVDKSHSLATPDPIEPFVNEGDVIAWPAVDSICGRPPAAPAVLIINGKHPITAWPTNEFIWTPTTVYNVASSASRQAVDTGTA